MILEEIYRGGEYVRRNPDMHIHESAWKGRTVGQILRHDHRIDYPDGEIPGATQPGFIQFMVPRRIRQWVSEASSIDAIPTR